MSDQLDW